MHSLWSVSGCLSHRRHRPWQRSRCSDAWPCAVQWMSRLPGQVSHWRCPASRSVRVDPSRGRRNRREPGDAGPGSHVSTCVGAIWPVGDPGRYGAVYCRKLAPTARRRCISRRHRAPADWRTNLGSGSPRFKGQILDETGRPRKGRPDSSASQAQARPVSAAPIRYKAT